MIGDVQSMNQQGLIIPTLNQPKSGMVKFDLPINLATTAMRSPDIEIKTIPDEIEFDIQMPAQFNTPNSKLEVKAAESSAGTISFNSNSEKLTQYSQVAPNSTIEFNVYKFDLNPSTVHDKPNADPANTDMQAIETKFSLAQAYMDIGDTEGAKELLQEVIESGHQNLTNQAKALLLKL
jgi:pilus assembly protein FimV